MTTLRIIIISAIILIFLIYVVGKINKKHGDGKLQLLFEQTFHNIKEEWSTIFILLIIVASMLGIHFLLEEDHLFLHLSLEFVGVIILFLLVEHAVSKLDSGISDFHSFPIEKFIAEVEKAKKEIILFDTIIEALILDTSHFEKFRTAVKKAYTKNKTLSFRVLILSHENIVEIEKTAQTLDLNKYKETIHDRLILIKKDIEATITNDTSNIIFRTSKTMTDFAMYSVDGKAYITFFPYQQNSTDSKQLFIPNDTDLAKSVYLYFYSRFESYWKLNTEIIDQKNN